MQEEEQKLLNYECNYNIYMISNIMHRNFKSPADRTKILLWIKHIQKYNRTVEQMYLRNDFIYFLLTCVKNSDLRPPFHEAPTQERLEDLQECLPRPTTSRADAEDLKNEWADGIPHIYKKSPDGGAFLSSQPIPKCGVFCYIAITGKSTKEAKVDD